MAGVARVNGFTQSDQFFGRTIAGITVSTLTAAPADVDGEHVKWPELDAAVQAIQTISTVSVVGAYAAGDTAINLIVEGVDAVGSPYLLADGTTAATLFAKLAELTGETVVVFVI